MYLLRMPPLLLLLLLLLLLSVACAAMAEHGRRNAPTVTSAYVLTPFWRQLHAVNNIRKS